MIQSEMNQRILDVQGALLNLQASYAEQSAALEKSKARASALEDAARDCERYALYEIRGGAFVYRRRPEVPPAEPEHCVCQTCFDKGVKAILEVKNLHMRGPTATCPVCERMISLGDAPPIRYDKAGIV